MSFDWPAPSWPSARAPSPWWRADGAKSCDPVGTRKPSASSTRARSRVKRVICSVSCGMGSSAARRVGPLAGHAGRLGRARDVVALAHALLGLVLVVVVLGRCREAVGAFGRAL